MDYITANGHSAVYDNTESRKEFARLHTTYFFIYLVYCVILRTQRPCDGPIPDQRALVNVYKFRSFGIINWNSLEALILDKKR
jgi:hypothetical protein